MRDKRVILFEVMEDGEKGNPILVFHHPKVEWGSKGANIEALLEIAYIRGSVIDFNDVCESLEGVEYYMREESELLKAYMSTEARVVINDVIINSIEMTSDSGTIDMSIKCEYVLKNKKVIT